jgi:methionyl-tRNA synthetase
MSKSLGNVIDPNLLIDEFGVDAIRYYFMSCFAINSENVFITDSLVANFNGDLANNFGNLVSRFIGLIKKYNNKKIPEINKDNLSDYAKKALNEIEIANKNIIENINKLDVLNICKEVMRVINYINKYIEDIKP